MSNTDGIEVWNRQCSTEGCYGLARIGSDYCIPCRKKRMKKGEKIK